MANCCGEELAAAVTAIASILAQDKTIDELAVLSGMFSMLSSAITLIAAQRELCEGNTSVPPRTSSPPGVIA